MNDTVVIVFPEWSDDHISTSLRELTKHICLKTEEADWGGVLGGQYGYGCDYENNVFMMHRFCWCESDDCPWCKFDEEAAPNFLFKETNATVHWYKYIGRSMEVEGNLPLDWLVKCVESIE